MSELIVEEKLLVPHEEDDLVQPGERTLGRRVADYKGKTSHNNQPVSPALNKGLKKGSRKGRNAEENRAREQPSLTRRTRGCCASRQKIRGSKGRDLLLKLCSKK